MRGRRVDWNVVSPSGLVVRVFRYEGGVMKGGDLME